MKEFLEHAAGIIAVAGFLWQLAKGHQAIYQAIDEKNEQLENQLFDLEKRFCMHEVECAEALKRIEQGISSLQIGQNLKTRS